MGKIKIIMSIVCAGLAIGSTCVALEKHKKRKEASKKEKEELEKRLAESAIKAKQFASKLKSHEKTFKEHKEFEKFVVAGYAIGLAVIYTDPEITNSKIQDLEEFIAGELNSEFPISFKEEIESLKKEPPNFNTAMEYVKKVPMHKWGVFDDIITLVKEGANIKLDIIAFEKAWEKYKIDVYSQN
jgi:hypothetical protein